MIRQNSENILDIFKVFLLAIFVFFGNLRNGSFESDELLQMFKLIQLSSLCVLCLCCVTDIVRMKIKQFFIFSLLFSFSVVNFAITKHTFFVGLVMIAVAFNTLNKRKTILFLNWVIIFSMILIVCLSAFGIISNEITYRSDGTIRYQLGYLTSTLPNSILLFTYLNFIFIFKKRTNIVLIIAYILLSYAFYKITGTRTGFYLTCFVSIVLILYKIKIFKKIIVCILNFKITKLILLTLPFLIFGLEIFLVYYYSKMTPLSFKLNELMSTRLSNTLYLYENYGFSLFGKEIPTSLEDGSYIGSDMCYFYYLFNFGVSFVILTFIIQIKLMKKAIKTRDFYLILCIFVLCVDGFVEPYILDYKYHFFAFLLVSPFMLNEKTRDFRRCKIYVNENNAVYN